MVPCSARSSNPQKGARAAPLSLPRSCLGGTVRAQVRAVWSPWTVDAATLHGAPLTPHARCWVSGVRGLRDPLRQLLYKTK